MSLGFQVNIIIHQLDKPRWEVNSILVHRFGWFILIFQQQIVNFPVTQKTIHLSYHNGEHYSSVRPREGNRLPSVSEASSDVASKNKSSEKKSPPVEPPANVSPEVKKKKRFAFSPKNFCRKIIFLKKKRWLWSWLQRTVEMWKW